MHLFEHSVNKLNNFIGGWYLTDSSICDRLIDYHKNSNDKFQGIVTNRIDKTQKDSTDVIIKDKTILDDYFVNCLKPITDLYRKKYIYCDKTSQWGIEQPINIQHYTPTGGFKVWHSERTAGLAPYNKRHLVFMTYLNDVTDAGETEFYYQNIKIKPEKGLTLIWPTDWTFTHRGVPSDTQEKYITTGWYDFL
jgi:hypothetical protein